MGEISDPVVQRWFEQTSLYGLTEKHQCSRFMPLTKTGL